MATIAARMQQRRRTAAQWTSENPILAAGEIGIEIGGPQPLVKIGDGSTAWTSLLYHYFPLYWKFPAGSTIPTGASTIVVSNGWGGVNLPAAGTSGLAFAQSLPPTWTTASMTWGYSPLTSGAGNVRWQASVRVVNVLGFGTLISDAPVTQDIFTQAASGGAVSLQMEHVFNHPSTFNCHSGSAVLGEVVQLSIERLGDDAADTCTSAVLVTNISIDRLT